MRCEGLWLGNGMDEKNQVRPNLCSAFRSLILSDQKRKQNLSIFNRPHKLAFIAYSDVWAEELLCFENTEVRP
jgi:hypothetical protein